jgi:hypothetical protein
MIRTKTAGTHGRSVPAQSRVYDTGMSPAGYDGEVWGANAEAVAATALARPRPMTCDQSVINWSIATLVALGLVAALHLANPPRVEAFIHEIIAAMCRAGGEEVVPPGQIRDGESFLAALMATGFITSIDSSDPSQVVIHFDPTIPASKFMSAGSSRH